MRRAARSGCHFLDHHGRQDACRPQVVESVVARHVLQLVAPRIGREVVEDPLWYGEAFGLDRFHQYRQQLSLHRGRNDLGRRLAPQVVALNDVLVVHTADKVERMLDRPAMMESS